MRPLKTLKTIHKLGSFVVQCIKLVKKLQCTELVTRLQYIELLRYRTFHLSVRSREISSVRYSPFTQAAVSRSPHPHSLPSRPVRLEGSAWSLGTPGRSVGEAHPPDALGRPAQAPRPGRGWGRAAGCSWLLRLHSGALGLRRLPRSSPADPSQPPGTSVSGLSYPNADPECRAIQRESAS